MLKIKIVIKLFLLVGVSFHAKAQIENCIKACNEDFNERFASDYTQVSKNDVRSRLYNYLKLTDAERSQTQNASSNGFDFGIPIKGVPLTFGSNASNTSGKSFMSLLQREVEEEGFLSDKSLNTFLAKFLPESAFSSYDNCIKTCGSVYQNSNGVNAIVTGDVNDQFIIELKYEGVQGGTSVKIKNLTYSGCYPLGGLYITEGLMINDRQSVYQQFVRKPDEAMSITVNFENNVEGIKTDVFPKVEDVTFNKMPIGSIISSPLGYTAFNEINGIRPLTFNSEKSAWAPCDGRNVQGSKYGSKISNVPDLRGVFVRGVNDMRVDGVPVISTERKNPDNNPAGGFQQHAIQSHKHQVFVNKNTKDKNISVANSNTAAYRASNDDNARYVMQGNNDEPSVGKTSTFGGNETRPKNVSLYYYIKIN